MIQFVKKIGSSPKNRRVFLFALAIGVLLISYPARADWSTAINDLLYNIFQYPGVQLLNFLIVILMGVASYNGFRDASIVEIGWPVMRDITNMFFVLILLIISIGTITRWPVMNYRQNLRRLIIMALLINFSKVIVLFFIDFSQVITLTFISEVQNVVQAATVSAFGLASLANPGETPGVINFLLGTIFVWIAVLVIAVMLIVFLVRILALWLIIVMAPLAFLASTLPQTDRWYKQWWDKLGSNLMVAPVLAFFLWLIFAVVVAPKNNGKVTIGMGTLDAVSVSAIKADSIIGYAVAIGLLIFSTKLAVSMGAAGGKIAANFAGTVGGKVKGAAQGARKYAWSGRSGQGGIGGRLANVGYTYGAALSSRVGLQTTAENIRMRQATRMAKRESAEGAGFKYLSHEELQRRATSLRTSAPERAVLRKEQITRGKIGSTKLEDMDPAEMQKIRQEIEYKKSGAESTFGVRGDTAFTKDKMDYRSMLDRTQEERDEKQEAIDKETAKKSPKFSAGDMKYRQVQDALVSKMNSGKMSNDDLARMLQDQEQDVIDSWLDRLEGDLSSLGAGAVPAGATIPANHANGTQGLKIKSVMTRLDPKNFGRYSQNSVASPGGGSTLPTAGAPGSVTNFETANEMAGNIRVSQLPQFNNAQLRDYGAFASRSSIEAAARELTADQTKVMIRGLKDQINSLGTAGGPTAGSVEERHYENLRKVFVEKDTHRLHDMYEMS